MKLVIAIIKPFKLDEVREALTEIGVAGMTDSMTAPSHLIDESDRALTAAKEAGRNRVVVV